MRDRIVTESPCQENVGSSSSSSAPDIHCMVGARSEASSVAALPCLNSHNSIEGSKETPPKLTGHAARRSFTVKENAAQGGAYAGGKLRPPHSG